MEWLSGHFGVFITSFAPWQNERKKMVQQHQPRWGMVLDRKIYYTAAAAATRCLNCLHQTAHSDFRIRLAHVSEMLHPNTTALENSTTPPPPPLARSLYYTSERVKPNIHVVGITETNRFLFRHFALTLSILLSCFFI